MKHAETKDQFQQHDFLFRAHVTSTKLPTVRADLYRDFDPLFKSQVSMQAFSRELEQHLGKTQSPTETYLVSMTPNLQWSVHKVGQKHKTVSHANEAGLVVIDLRKWRQSKNPAVFRACSLFDFLEFKGHPVTNSTWKQWARNCNEYVAIGEIPPDSVIRWVTWTEILNTGFLPRNFYWSYTLDIVRRWNYVLEEEDEILSEKIGQFVNALAGTNSELKIWVVDYLIYSDFWSWGRSSSVRLTELKSVGRETSDGEELAEDFEKLVVKPPQGEATTAI